MKKRIAFLITLICLLITISGCTDDTQQLLPYNLKFGMHYQEMQKVFPELEGKSISESKMIFIYNNDGVIEDFYGVNTDQLDKPIRPEGQELTYYYDYKFTFNLSDQLFRVSISNDNIYFEESAKCVYDAWVNYYSTVLSLEPHINGREAYWKTEALEIKACLYELDNGGYKVELQILCNTFHPSNQSQ